MAEEDYPKVTEKKVEWTEWEKEKHLDIFDLDKFVSELNACLYLETGEIKREEFVTCLKLAVSKVFKRKREVRKEG